MISCTRQERKLSVNTSDSASVSSVAINCHLLTLFDCSMISNVILRPYYRSKLSYGGLCNNTKTYWYSSHESRFQHAGVPFTALLYLGGLWKWSKTNVSRCLAIQKFWSGHYQEPSILLRSRSVLWRVNLMTLWSSIGVDFHFWWKSFWHDPGRNPHGQGIVLKF